MLTPLIALMKDQVDSLKSKGVAAAALHSQMSSEDRQKVLRAYENNKLKLLYVTPERFQKPEFLKIVTQQKTPLLAVDEAHCISQWGHDFRPDYSKIAEIRQTLGMPPTIFLTATATKEVQADILKQSGLTADQVNFFGSQTVRSNLSLKVLEVYGLEEKIRSVIGLLHQLPKPALIYFSLISTLEKTSQELQKLNVAHEIYHGRLNWSQRKRSQEKFSRGESDIFLATPAFGLGIHKSDIRQIIHMELPGSLESYTQEVGRAGRDGLMSWGSLLFDQDDVQIQMDFQKWSTPEPSFIRQVYRLIEEYADRIKMEGLDFLRQQLLYRYRHDYRLETSLGLLESWGCIVQEEPGKPFWKAIEAPTENYLSETLYSQRMKTQQTKLLQMLQFCGKEICRVQQLQEYFEEPQSKKCGHCDICEKEKHV